MARKQVISKEGLIDGAFRLVEEQGIGAMSARNLAKFCGCSTQPIFRVYENMQELHEEVFQMAVNYFSEFYETGKQKEQVSGKPFVQFGLLYIEFALKEPRLFTMLFLSPNRYGRSLYELLNGSTGAFVREMNRAKAEGVKDPGSLFMKMWIFIHGAACMTITGDYDLPREETIRLLEDTYAKSAS